HRSGGARRCRCTRAVRRPRLPHLGELQRRPARRHAHHLDDRAHYGRRGFPVTGHGLYRPATPSAEWIGSLDLSTPVLLFALSLFYIVLGCFLDGISAIVLTMAVVEPMLRAQGIDLPWYGIFLVILVEMAQITPPVGFNLFVLQDMTNHDIIYIARTALPMFGVICFAVVLITLFPEIVTFLPEQMDKIQRGAQTQ